MAPSYIMTPHQPPGPSREADDPEPAIMRVPYPGLPQNGVHLISTFRLGGFAPVVSCRCVPEANVCGRFSNRWTMGSVLFLASWAVMMGPLQYGECSLSRAKGSRIRSQSPFG